MNSTRNTDVRLAALARIVEREAKHLATTDRRLFQKPLSTDDIAEASCRWFGNMHRIVTIDKCSR